MADEDITFELAPDHAKALETIAATRKMRLSGEVKDGKLVIDSVSFASRDFSRAIFVPVNAPFKTAQACAS